MSEERIERLERILSWSINRILGDEWPNDIGSINVVESQGAIPAPSSPFDPSGIIAAIAELRATGEALAAQQTAIMDAIQELSGAVSELAASEALETAALVAARASMHEPSRELIAADAAKYGRTIEEHEAALRDDYQREVARIMAKRAA